MLGRGEMELHHNSSEAQFSPSIIPRSLIILSTINGRKDDEHMSRAVQMIIEQDRVWRFIVWMNYQFLSVVCF